MTAPIIGLRTGETQEITLETIAATGQAMGLTRAQITAALEAIMEAEEELKQEPTWQSIT